MPLIPGRSKKTIQQNTEELIASGKKPDQAYAIANAVARRERPPSRQSTSARTAAIQEILKKKGYK